MTMAYCLLAVRVMTMSVEKIIVSLLGNRDGDMYKNIAGTFLFFVIGGICLIPFVFLEDIFFDLSFILPCYLSSLIYSIGFVAYVTSLSTGEVSLVTPVNSLNSLFLLLLSAIFLGESITVQKFAGIVLMITGVSILNKKGSLIKGVKSILHDKPCMLMLVYACLQSIGRVMDKLFYTNVSPVIYSTFLYFFVSANLYIFLKVKGKGKAAFELFKAKPAISIASGAINGYSYFILLITLRSLELSVVEPVTQVSMIVTIILTKILFKEEIRSKIPGALIILAGGWVLIS